MDTSVSQKLPITWTSMKCSVVKKFKNQHRNPVECLPENVVNKIFDYFKVKELLELSLVNRQWYEFIGKSTRCMDKIKILIIEPKSGHYPLYSMQDALFMTQNGRNYMHISLARLEFGLQTQHKLLLANFQWQTVSLTNHQFKSQIELNNFLGIIEPFVEELVLHTVRHKKSIPKISKQNYRFPKLTKLSIINCYSFIYNEAFKDITSLRCLNLASDDLPDHLTTNVQVTLRVQGIKNILVKNHKMEYLELFIGQKDFDALFMDERFVRDVQFCLHSLYVGSFKQADGKGINVIQFRNFVRFLNSQEYSLVNLYLEKWLGNRVLQYAINDMQLRSLTITMFEKYGCHNDSLDRLSLLKNETIEHLAVLANNSDDHRVVTELVKVCHELKYLEITLIDQEIFDILVENGSELEVIICDFFTAFNPPSKPVLNKLRHMEVRYGCAENFRDIIAYQDYFTNFERVFLEAAWKLHMEMNVHVMVNNFYITYQL